MQSKVTYEFAVIRLVPQVEREEFLNIGVILFSKRKQYLGIKYKVDSNKIKSFSNNVEPTMINQYLEAWKAICEGGSKGGFIGTLEISLRFRWLAATRSTIIQSSKTHSGLCDDPEEILEDIFKRIVL